MKKSFINELASTLSYITDNNSKKMADLILAEYINKSNDIEFITKRTTDDYIYNDDCDLINLIDLAIDYKFDKTICIIIEKYPELVTKTENSYPTLIHRAIKNGMESVGLLALQKNPSWAEIQDSQGQTFVHIALERNFEEIGWKALSTNPVVSAIQDANKNTFAHIAMRKGMYALGFQALKTMPEIASIQNANHRTIFQEAENSKKVRENFVVCNKQHLENLRNLINEREKELSTREQNSSIEQKRSSK
ncbi:MAG: ankyrin repeat domain-containing protein [Candidatus Caccovivens sp.]